MATMKLINYYGGVKIVVTTLISSGHSYELMKTDLYTGDVSRKVGYITASDSISDSIGSNIIFYDFNPVWGTVYTVYDNSTEICTSTLKKCNSIGCICDETGIYPIQVDVNIGNINKKNNIAQYDVMNSKFPVFVTTYNNEEYKSGQITFRPTGLGVNLKDSRPSIIKDAYTFDRNLMENDLNQIMKMLTNKRPKCLKIANQNVMIVMITDTPQFSITNGSLTINSISFNYTECADVTFENLNKYGMIVQPSIEGNRTFDNAIFDFDIFE